jgi:hypothetical protein
VSQWFSFEHLPANTNISISGVDLTEFITSWTFSQDSNTIDVTTFGIPAHASVITDTWNTATFTVSWPDDYDPYWAYEEGV